MNTRAFAQAPCWYLTIMLATMLGLSLVWPAVWLYALLFVHSSPTLVSSVLSTMMIGLVIAGGIACVIAQQDWSAWRRAWPAVTACCSRIFCFRRASS
jgi:hypothetical protein